MSHQDTGLYKSFAMVLGALVFFTLFCIVMANIFSPSTDYSNDPLIANSVKQQIAPVGRSNVRADATATAESTEQTKTEDTATASAETATSEDAAATDTATATATATTTATTETEVVEAETTQADSGDSSVATTETVDVETAKADTSIEIPVKVRAVVATNCAGCHANGIKGAQRNDDTAAWQGLAEKGIEALTASVINGKGEMPARAESSLDDAELQLAVQHMINKNLAGSQPAAKADTAAASTESAEESAAVTESATETKQEESAATDAAATEAVVIPDNVKASVDTLCAACHISGVGNAPKYGDKEAWAARMANGIDAVTASAIAGKGAMPARGGSQLTDEEIKLAIQYMVSK